MPSASPYELIAHLRDPSRRKREVAAEALSKHGDEQGVVEALQRAAADDPEVAVRGMAVMSLYLLHDRSERTAQIYRQALRRDGSEFMTSMAAINGLAVVGDESDIPLLVQFEDAGDLQLDAVRWAVEDLRRGGRDFDNPRPYEHQGSSGLLDYAGLWAAARQAWPPKSVVAVIAWFGAGFMGLLFCLSTLGVLDG